MEEKLKQLVHLLQQIDDELNNEICLDTTCLDDGEEPLTEFTFWGIADMVIDYMHRRENND